MSEEIEQDEGAEEQKADLAVALPQECVEYSQLHKRFLAGELVTQEADLARYNELRPRFQPELDADDPRPKVDYDGMKFWPLPFEGEVLKDTPIVAPFITLMMIVKNEGRTLARSIESVREVVDEVVIGVDDSCTDDTEKVALVAGDVVFRFKWRNDFAWARNNAKRKVRGQWILILDGHEELDNASLPFIRVYTEGAVNHKKGEEPAPYSVVMAATVMNPKSEEEQGMVFTQPRLFRNIQDHFYRYDTHHQLVGAANVSVFAPVIRFYHMMPEAREQERAVQRGTMNTANLLQMLGRDPFDERASYYLANTYMDHHEYETAKAWYLYLAKITPTLAYKYHCWQQLATLEMSLGAQRGEEESVVVERVLVCLHEARKLCWYRAETLISLGQIAEAREDLLEAEHWFKQAISVKLPTSTILTIRKECYTWLPWKLLAQLYEKQKNWEQTLSAAERWLEYLPQDAEAHALWRLAEARVLARKAANGANIIVFDAIGSFSGPIINAFVARGHQVEVYKSFDSRFVGGADWLFFEWGDANLVKATRQNPDAGVICRVHRYEPYQGMLQAVDFKKVDHIIFTSEHIRQAAHRFGNITGNCQEHVIPSSVQLDRWDFQQRKDDRYNLVYIGYLNWKKGIPMLLQILLELVRLDSKYTLTVMGRWQGQELEEYAMNMVEQMGLRNNIRWVGWQTDVNAALDKHKIGQVLNCSICEGSPYSVVEAMAKGIKPVVHAWPGAREIYEGQEDFADLPVVFDTIADAVSLISETPVRSDQYRAFVERYHNHEEEMRRIYEIMELKEVSQSGEDDPAVHGQSDKERAGGTGSSTGPARSGSDGRSGNGRATAGDERHDDASRGTGDHVDRQDAGAATSRPAL